MSDALHLDGVFYRRSDEYWFNLLDQHYLKGIQLGALDCQSGTDIGTSWNSRTGRRTGTSDSSQDFSESETDLPAESGELTTAAVKVEALTPSAEVNDLPLLDTETRPSSVESDVRKFACPTCQRRFLRAAHMHRHVSCIHKRKKPCRCDVCGRKFSRSDNMKQHRATHRLGLALFLLGYW